MAAVDHLNVLQHARYFHGTGGAIEGGVVRPRTSTWNSRSMDELAFASSRVADAMDFAAMGAHHQGRLFGSVYEVSPRNPKPSPMGDPRHVVSAEGMDVIKHTGFVHYDEKTGGAKWV
jgi:hypothetical protein